MTQTNDYGARIETALAYIATHLDEDLSFETLAEVACFSPFHFHRIYSAMVGESVRETVQRLRLHRAAGQLLREDRSIERIARRAGYSSQSAFTRAFRNAYGIPPARYRGQTVALRDQMKGDPAMHKVEVIQREELPVAYLEHRGDYLEIGTVFERLIVSAIRQGLVRGEPTMFGTYFDDPKSVNTSKLRSQACLPVSPEWKAVEGLEKGTIAAGKYARMLHVGPYSELSTSYDWLYGTWLPESGEEPDDRPVVEEYLNNPREVAPSELKTLIWAPIR